MQVTSAFGEGLGKTFGVDVLPLRWRREANFVREGGSYVDAPGYVRELVFFSFFSDMTMVLALPRFTLHN